MSISPQVGHALSVQAATGSAHDLNTTLNAIFGPAKHLIGILASFWIPPMAVIAPSAQLMNTLSGVRQVAVLHLLSPLIVELVVSITELVLGSDVISPTPLIGLGILQNAGRWSSVVKMVMPLHKHY